MGGSTTIGYSYYADWSIGFTQRASALREIWYGDRLAWSGDIRENGYIKIDARDLFGGDDAGGGLQGTAYVAFGGNDQLMPTGDSKGGSGDSKGGSGDSERGSGDSERGSGDSERGSGAFTGSGNYRGFVSIHFINCYVTSLQKSVYTVEAVLEYVPTGEVGDPMIGESINPASLLYEIISDQTAYKWLASPVENINKQSFIEANEYCRDKGIGISANYDSDMSASDIFSNVLAIINGVVIPGDTGEIELVIYKEASVEPFRFSESNINESSLSTLKQQTQFNPVSSVQVKYRDKSEKTDRTFTAWASSDSEAEGEAVSIGYRSIDSAHTASEVANREVISRSGNMLSMELSVSSAIQGLPSVGDVCRVSLDVFFGENEIEGSALEQELLFRVTEKSHDPRSGGELVTFKISEDLLTRLSSGGFDIESPEAPDNDSKYIAKPTTIAFGQSAPFFALDALSIIDSSIVDLGEEEAIPMFFAVAPANTITNNFELWRVTSDDYASRYENGDYCKAAIITSDISLFDSIIETSFTVDFYDPSAVVGMTFIMQLNDEIIGARFATIDDLNAGKMEIDRGLFDSVPSAHAADSQIFAIANAVTETAFAATNTTRFTAYTAISGKVRVRTSRDLLSLEDSQEVAIDLEPRHYKPLPPASVRINGLFYTPTRSSSASETLVSFMPRDRKTQKLAAYCGFFDDVGDVLTENTTYKVKYIQASNSQLIKEIVVDVEAGEDAQQHTVGLTYNEEIAILGQLTENIKIVVVASKDGLESVEFEHEMRLTQ